MFQRFRAFMYGRNGVDALNIALIILYFVLSLVFSFNYWLRLVSFIPFILVLVRLFSKNLAQRKTENDRFLAWWNPTKDFFIKWNNRLQDQSHKYVKCKNCNQTLRLPKGKGKLNVTCPKCGNHFTKKT